MPQELGGLPERNSYHYGNIHL